MKKTRFYIQLLDKALLAAEEAVDAFNRVGKPYKTETCLILTTNAWELLAKSILVKIHENISSDRPGSTITAEHSISRLRVLSLLDENQEDCVQQIISLRNYATHYVMPALPAEILHHLMFFSCKFFRDTVGRVFPSYVKRLSDNYLSLSFSQLTTYADKVKKLVAKVKRSDNSKKLIWLLERGIQFDGNQYIDQNQFELQYKRKRRILPHLALGDFLKKTDMVRIIAIQAPKNYSVDITLRKGKPTDTALPVVVKKTDIEVDYPYLTAEIAKKINKNTNFTAAVIKLLSMKGNSQYHMSVRSSKSGSINRYSESAFNNIKKFLTANPSINPYLELKKRKK